VDGRRTSTQPADIFHLPCRRHKYYKRKRRDGDGDWPLSAALFYPGIFRGEIKSTGCGSCRSRISFIKIPSTIEDIKEHGRNGARADFAEVIVHANVIFNDRVVFLRGGQFFVASAKRRKRERSRGSRELRRSWINQSEMTPGRASKRL